ncbi:MAG: VOC family protein [Ruminiclostridium sp.]|nr:VOC family protein [Ruminiclostridium sp.]
MRIEHIAVYVKDLERTKSFFTKYFNGISNDGYYNSITGFKSYFLTFEDGARLEIMNKPNLTDFCSNDEVFGYSHIAFSVGSIDAVNSLTEQLLNDGFKVISGPRTTGDGYYESCIVDMEGNRIEITV